MKKKRINQAVNPRIVRIFVNYYLNLICRVLSELGMHFKSCQPVSIVCNVGDIVSTLILCMFVELCPASGISYDNMTVSLFLFKPMA